MRKPIYYLTAILLLFSLSIMTSCKDDEEDEVTPENEEFVADNNSFKDFDSWMMVAQHQGPDPALGQAHHGNDSTVVREVFFKNDQMPVNGVYPTGTIIVKESTNPDNSIHEVTAMVKRGNDFNPSGGDWEWFMLTPNGDIAKDQDGNAMRGANLMNGMCLSCHTQASNDDYVFSR